MSDICIYDRDEQCFEDCPWCPKFLPDPDPDTLYQTFKEDNIDE